MKLRAIKEAIKVIKKVQVIVKAIAVFNTVLFLSGCIGMNSKFDCNVSSGGKCAPMNSIHKMADQGMFNSNSDGNGNDKRNRNNNHNHKLIENSTMAKLSTSQGYPSGVDNFFIGKPIRSAETVQQIWIGPYEDTNGNYHESAYLYAVVKKSRWISEEKEIGQD